MAVAQRIVVVGGNGYLGSAICKAAVAKGWMVDSISSSGNPSLTPAGHSRAWTSSPLITWHKASAFSPSTYSHLLGPATAVVHTLGILLEKDYKPFVRSGDLLGLAGAVMGRTEGNPLKGKRREETYEGMNRDAALEVLRTLIDSKSTLPSTPTSPTHSTTPFIYISAEDIFRPFVDARYIDTKREAEREIARICSERDYELFQKEEKSDAGSVAAIRPVFVRPGLMYHPHIRPLSTPLAVMLDISSSLHSRFSPFLPRFLASAATPPPTTSNPLDALRSIRTALAIPPIHVDLVAASVISCVEDEGWRGVVDTRDMRRIVGLEDRGEGEGGEEDEVFKAYERSRAL